jgi:hypothetical protein
LILKNTHLHASDQLYAASFLLALPVGLGLYLGEMLFQIPIFILGAAFSSSDSTMNATPGPLVALSQMALFTVYVLVVAQQTILFQALRGKVRQKKYPPTPSG